MTSDTGTSVRYQHLDGLRGVAASIVVFAHFMSAVYPSGVFGGGMPLHGGWEFVFLHPPLGILVGGYFAVCLFFLLSGYVLALPLLHRGSSWREIVVATVKRPFRLAGMVLATTLLSWLLWRTGMYDNHDLARISGSKWFAAFWPPPAPGAGRVLWHLATSPLEKAALYNAPMWTIRWELFGSFLVYGILLVARTRPIRWCVMLAAAYVLRGGLLQGFIVGVMFADWQCARSWPASQGGGSLPWWLAAILVLLALVCGSYPEYAVTDAGVHQALWSGLHLPWLGGGWPMVGAVAVFVVAVNEPIAWRILSCRPVLFLGRVSYSMYGVHLLVLGSVSSWVFVSMLPVCGYLLASALALLSLAVVTLACAWMLHVTVDTFFIWAARLIGCKVLGWLRLWGSRESVAEVPAASSVSLAAKSADRHVPESTLG